MIKIQKEYVSASGRQYVRTLDASSKPGSADVHERINWRCDNRRIRQGRYLSLAQWQDIERQVKEAYAEEYDVDFTSIFDIYTRDYSGLDGVLFYETYSKGEEQFGHSSNILHIGPVGSYVPPPVASNSQQYTTTTTTSFASYASEARRKKQESANSNKNVIQMDYAALGIR